MYLLLEISSCQTRKVLPEEGKQKPKLERGKVEGIESINKRIRAAALIMLQSDEYGKLVPTK